MFASFPSWFLLLVLCFGVLACRQTPEPAPTPAPSTTVEAPKERRFMRTKTTRLRVRQTPDLEGAVLDILPEGSLIEYLHDSTSFTTEIIFNRENYNTHWYKVETENQSQGWVYAAFVQFLPPSLNRQLIAQHESAALAQAANEEQAQQIAKPTTEEQQEQVNDALLQSYQHLLAQLPSGQPQAVGEAVDRYKSLFVGRANGRTHDAAYVAFRQWYSTLLAQLRQRYKGQHQYLAPELQRYQRAHLDGTPALQVFGDNGFNFALQNGQVVLAEDVDWIYRTFFREVSTTMRAYMNQYELEEPNFWYQNESLGISPTQLARWVLSWNYFVATYPDFVWHNDALRRLTLQLDLLLEGTDQQPAFGTDRLLHAAYRDAYTYIAQNYPNSNIGKAFQRYLDLLEANEYYRSSAVDNERLQLRKQLLKKQ